MSAADLKNAHELTAEDYQKANVEVAFLLDAFASTIDNIMGGNTAPTGRIAGRDTASKLPVHLEEPSFAEVIALLRQQMQAGFGISLQEEGLFFDRCIIRQMCALRRIEPGGALCRLFHSYFDGIVNGLLSRPVRSEIVSVGEQCRLDTVVK